MAALRKLKLPFFVTKNRNLKTSMEKMIGVLGEAFEENNTGATFTYNPTGSGID